MVADPGRCPACGGALEDWRLVPASDPILGAQRFQMARCVRCGSGVTSGVAPPGLYESGAYRPGTPRLHAAALPLLRLFDRQRLSLIRALVSPPARLLDVGAGRGRFVLSARTAGYAASGIESSDRGVEAAIHAGADVSRARIEDATQAPGSVDVATLWHVLEHLDDPAVALERVGSWLRPGGVLLVGVPNLASLQARLGGERWYHLDVPRHRVHFTPHGLNHILRATGFEIRSTHHLLLEHNVFGMWQSLVSRLTTHPSYLYNLLKRNVAPAPQDLALTIAAVPLIPAAGLVEAAAALCRRGGTIAVVAQRR